MQKEIDTLEFVQKANFELIYTLKNNGEKNLLIFDNSFEETCKSTFFVDIAAVGRNRGLNTFTLSITCFIKANCSF